MTYEINQTHDPNLKSWVESANDPNTDFPIQNLPFCVFRRAESYEDVRIGVAIGSFILDVYGCYQAALFDDDALKIAVATDEYCLDHAVMRKNTAIRAAFRQRLVEILSAEADAETQKSVSRNLIPIAEAEFWLPAHIADYTDFYCS